MSEPREAGGRIWRQCPLCGTERGKPHLAKGSLRLVRCSRCAMVFANPVEPIYLNGAVYEHQAASYQLSPDKLESDYAAVRFRRELALFRRFCREGAVLDVGCSNGAFLHQLQERYPRSYRVRGTDVASPALAYAETRGVPVLRADFLAHDFGAEQFDAITLWAVLEHLPEPKRALAKAAALLRPGGWCFLLVPNLQSLAVRLLGKRYRYFMPEHLNYFTDDTLRRLLDRERTLSLRHLGSTHFNPAVIWQDRSAQRGFVAAADRARLLRRTTRWKQSVLWAPFRPLYWAGETLLSRLGLADNLVAVVQKE